MTEAFTPGIAGDVGSNAGEDLKPVDPNEVLDSAIADAFTSGITDNVGCIINGDLDSAIADAFTFATVWDVGFTADEDCITAIDDAFTPGIAEDAGSSAAEDLKLFEPNEDLDSVMANVFPSGIAGDVGCIADEDLDSAIADAFPSGIAWDGVFTPDIVGYVGCSAAVLNPNEVFGLDVGKCSFPNLVVDNFNPDFDEVDGCNPFVSFKDFGSSVDEDTEWRTEGFNPGFSTEDFDWRDDNDFVPEVVVEDVGSAEVDEPCGWDFTWVSVAANKRLRCFSSLRSFPGEVSVCRHFFKLHDPLLLIGSLFSLNPLSYLSHWRRKFFKL